MVKHIKIGEISKNDRPNTNNSEEKKIRNILGHPVKRVIHDKQGNVILDIGDIISFHALERVKQANVLDYLFGSVYRK
ncbi:hypothetical protein [Rivularia sp. PCC 7116]|uniref:hypothetical protein n=1 Tax=Rivularia sp. PCC 7116 TaxID=373994 RepID=UPI000302E8CA|nr:hypothetical protein [Rivularia sp. PCC 7116]